MYEPKRPTYTGPTGIVVELNCDWCGAAATKAFTVAPGRTAGHCDACEGKARRFHASVTPELQNSGVFKDTNWLPSAEHPDLIINHAGKGAITIRDHRQLKAKALKELLPKAKIRKPRKKAKAKASKPLTHTERLEDLARRREDNERLRVELDTELRELLAEPDDAAVAVVGSGDPAQSVG